MLKKIMTLAVAALAVLAVSAPAASATWFKHHSAIQADETVQLTGQFKFSSVAVGSIECQTEASMQFLAGQTTTLIPQFGLDTGSTPTKRCVTGGPLGPCDVTSFTSDATIFNAWVAHLLQNKDTIEITTGTSQNKLEGSNATTQTQHTACALAQIIQLKGGTIYATIVGSTCTVSQVTLSGQLETQTGAKVTISGTQSVIPGATYGTLC